MHLTTKYILKAMIWLALLGLLLPLHMNTAMAKYSYDLDTSMNPEVTANSKTSNRNTTLGFYNRKYTQDYKLLQPISAKEHPITQTESAYGVTIDWDFVD